MAGSTPQAASGPGKPRLDRRDVFLAAIAFAVTFGYLCLLPPALIPGDEANYLQAAKRVARGEVIYRDVFELTTPGWIFLVATLFRLFGTDIATAKLATAVIHGLTAAMLFLAGRISGVRRILAWPISLLYVAIAMPAWPVASQHWLATMLSVGLLLACMTLPREPAIWCIVPGVLLGLFVSTHQRGLVVGAGVVTWLLVDRLLLGRRGRQSDATGVVADVASLTLGTLVVLVPLALYLLATGGGKPLWDALITHPLVNYRTAFSTSWAGAGLTFFTFPSLLKYAPIVLIAPLLRLGRVLWLRARPTESRMTPTPGAPPDEISLVLLSTITCVASMASILYFPGIGHIAFISPFFLVVLAQSVEWGVRGVPRAGNVLRTLGYGTVLALLVATAAHLGRNLRIWRGFFPLRQDTAFGRVAVGSTVVTEQLDYLRGLLHGAANPSLFGYPSSASSLCLMTDARNPTRYEFFSPGYNTPAQVQEVLAVLTNEPPTYLIVNGALGPLDPVKPILDRHYTVFFAARGPGQFTILKPRDGWRARMKRWTGTTPRGRRRRERARSGANRAPLPPVAMLPLERPSRAPENDTVSSGTNAADASACARVSPGRSRSSPSSSSPGH